MHGTVVEHEDDLAGLAAEESYEQTVVDEAGTAVQRRALRSHVLVFQLPPAESWLACRDVFEVDGVAVPNHRERLQEVLSATGPSVDLAHRIYQESARYNIGDVVRTFNLPTFALAFFRPAFRKHFTFTKLGEEPIASRNTWVIGFRERGKPAFVATPSGEELPVRGRVWVLPDDGRIVRTEVVVGGDRRMKHEAQVTTTFRLESSLHLWVPDVMDERYTVPPGRSGGGSVVLGHAVYSGARRLGFKGRLRLEQVPPPAAGERPQAEPTTGEANGPPPLAPR